MNDPKQTPIGESGLPPSVQIIFLQQGYASLEQVLAITVTELIEMNWLTSDILDALALATKKNNENG